MQKWLSIAPDGKPYWQMMDNNVNLIRTLPALVHDDNNVEDLDSSGDDHNADSMRYGLSHIKFIDGSVGTIDQRTQHRTYNTVPSINIDDFAEAPLKHTDWKR